MFIEVHSLTAGKRALYFFFFNGMVDTVSMFSRITRFAHTNLCVFTLFEKDETLHVIPDTHKLSTKAACITSKTVVVLFLPFRTGKKTHFLFVLLSS